MSFVISLSSDPLYVAALFILSLPKCDEYFKNAQLQEMHSLCVYFLVGCCIGIGRPSDSTKSSKVVTSSSLSL